MNDARTGDHEQIAVAQRTQAKPPIEPKTGLAQKQRIEPTRQRIREHPNTDRVNAKALFAKRGAGANRRNHRVIEGGAQPI
jgi:hypothetical protein